MKHNYQLALGDIFYDISCACACAVYNSGEIFIQKAQKYFFHFMWRSEICWESYRSNFESWYVIVNCLHGHWKLECPSTLLPFRDGRQRNQSHRWEKYFFINLCSSCNNFFICKYLFLNSISPRLPKLKLTVWQSLTCFSCMIFRRKEF